MPPFRLRAASRGLLALLFGPMIANAHTWSLIETSKDSGRRLAEIQAPPAVVAAPPDSAVVCEPTKLRQEMVGFGGALSESSAWVLSLIPASSRAEILRRYYDPEKGIGYTLARTHFSSCDFSLSSWSLAETPGDYYLHDFSLKPMRRWVLPLVHEAHDIAGPERFRLLASPWSPPAWMKTNNRMDLGGALRPEYRATWAKLFVKFVEAMKNEEKLPVWALTVQNEPEATQTWESCIFHPEEERDFVRDHLGPALAEAGLGGVKLLGLDHNRDLLEARAKALFGDPESAKYLWGTAIHWYVSEDFAASSRVHAAFPEKRILYTEGCREGGLKLGSYDRGERYGRNMIGDFRNWVCGWIDWNIVLDETGGPNHVGNLCDAPVIVDTKTGMVHYQTSFFYIAHFSRYVKTGARCIESGSGPSGLQSVAFLNPDGILVFVAMNESDQPIGFSLAVEGETLACSAPVHSIQTYLRSAR